MLSTSALGQKTVYDAANHPDLLFPIPRNLKRMQIGIEENQPLPFQGYDIWNHYEVSWLNEKGKPIAAIAELIYGCESTHIIESKSLKLYFNSLNNMRFENSEAVIALVKKDIELKLNCPILSLKIISLNQFSDNKLFNQLEGIYLDDLDIECTDYHCDPDFLHTESTIVEEVLFSDLLKSNCLVTNQPDWCSIRIAYQGNKINHEGLLRYLISFRNDNEFHEQCIEKIFMHILQRCHPQKLSVYGRSTRRGGIDINSYRTTGTFTEKVPNVRLIRQ